VSARRTSSSEAQVAPFLARKLKGLDAELGRGIRRVLAKADEEAVHDTRVTIRRLRTMLRFARPVFGRFYADAVRRSFAEVQSATGELRDEEAMGETLEALGIDDPTFVAWRVRRQASVTRDEHRLQHDGRLAQRGRDVRKVGAQRRQLHIEAAVRRQP